MAAKKKAKSKRSKAKKAKKVKKSPARKAAKKKTASKKRVKAKAKRTKPKKAKAKKAKAKAKAKKRVKGKAQVARRAPSPVSLSLVPGPSSIISAAPPPGDRLGTVTHYFTHLGVAIVQLENGSLREGDTVHIKGHTSDFRQRVESMELDHVHVNAAYAGQSVGLRVGEHAREHDVVYKVA